MNAADLCYTPATRLAAMIRAKEISPVELTRTVLERIERVNPKVNAFCVVLKDQALASAREAEAAVMKGGALPPLLGIPFSIKDLAMTKGVRTTGGSHIYADRVPAHDAPFVRRLKAAGGVFLGKTTSPEFGWKGLSDSPLLGVTRNPWNPAMTTGGSSAGAGAAAAAGLGPLCHGSDGAGSIRIPSAFCGVFGHKPSYGRVPQWPVSNNDYQTHNGPMTRTVADAALMLSVMIVAAISVHWQHGVFAMQNGIEVPLLYATGALAIALAGPGQLSLDALLGIASIWTPKLTALVLAGGVAGGVANLMVRRAPVAT